MLVTGVNQPYKTLKEVLEQARAKPGSVDYGSLGVGSGPHVVMEMMANMAGVKLNHVPYKASPLSDVVAGQVLMAFDPATTAIPMVRGGKARALAVTSRKRIPSLPDVPTVSEALPGYDGDGWQGFYLPAGTPKEIVARYNTELVRILRLPEVRAKLADLGLQAVGNSIEEFAAISKAEYDKWGKIAKDNNIRVE